MANEVRSSISIDTDVFEMAGLRALEPCLEGGTDYSFNFRSIGLEGEITSHATIPGLYGYRSRLSSPAVTPLIRRFPRTPTPKKAWNHFRPHPECNKAVVDIWFPFPRSLVSIGVSAYDVPGTARIESRAMSSDRAFVGFGPDRLEIAYQRDCESYLLESEFYGTKSPTDSKPGVVTPSGLWFKLASVRQTGVWRDGQCDLVTEEIVGEDELSSLDCKGDVQFSPLGKWSGYRVVSSLELRGEPQQVRVEFMSATGPK